MGDSIDSLCCGAKDCKDSAGGFPTVYYKYALKADAIVICWVLVRLLPTRSDPDCGWPELRLGPRPEFNLAGLSFA